MLSVDGFLSAWDRVDWTLNFSFGDLATLIMGLGTLAVAIAAIRLQRRQNEFVEMQTQLLKKQTEIQHSLAQIEKTKFDREDKVFKKELMDQTLSFCHAITFGKDLDGQQAQMFFTYKDHLAMIFNDDIANLVSAIEMCEVVAEGEHAVESEKQEMKKRKEKYFHDLLLLFFNSEMV